MVTLSVDEEQDKLVAFMKQKGYTFPVLASKAYVQTVVPQFMLGQFWIVNGSGSVRLQRTANNTFGGAEDAVVLGNSATSFPVTLADIEICPLSGFAWGSTAVCRERSAR